MAVPKHPSGFLSKMLAWICTTGILPVRTTVASEVWDDQSRASAGAAAGTAPGTTCSGPALCKVAVSSGDNRGDGASGVRFSTPGSASESDANCVADRAANGTRWGDAGGETSTSDGAGPAGVRDDAAAPVAGSGRPQKPQNLLPGGNDFSHLAQYAVGPTGVSSGRGPEPDEVSCSDLPHLPHFVADAGFMSPQDAHRTKRIVPCSSASATMFPPRVVDLRSVTRPRSHTAREIV